MSFLNDNNRVSVPMANIKTEVVRNGISFGTALAIVISWSHNHSIIWGIVHGLLSWIYIIYYVFKYY